MPAISGTAAGQIAVQGALALTRLLQPEGKFIYRFRASSEPKPGRKYNVLRHCGTAWSMMEVGRHMKLPQVSQAAERAVQHMVQSFLLPYGDTDMLCVVDGGKIKLGGNGLALLALAELLEARWDADLARVAQRLGRYIVSEQLEDGDFVHSRVYETNRVRAFRSDYYTGEALFGLLRLHEVTGEKEWLDCALASEGELFKRNYGVFSQSHWMLYALEQLHRHSGANMCLEHARQIAEHILMFPDYRKDKRSTPIACRSEGLLAYIRMAERSGDRNMSPDAESCLREVRRNLSLQLEFKTPTGAFVRGGGSDEIRIDYIQHNISAFLAYQRLCRTPNTGHESGKAGRDEHPAFT
jgi:hypothetical protein